MWSGFPKKYTVFELCKAVGQRNIKRSLFVVKKMVEFGEAPLKILFQLTSYYTKLWKVKELKKRSAAQQEVAGVIGIHPFFVAEYLQNADKYSESEFQHVFTYLLHADIDIKRSYMKPSILMELLIYKICRVGQEPTVQLLF